MIAICAVMLLCMVRVSIKLLVLCFMGHAERFRICAACSAGAGAGAAVAAADWWQSFAAVGAGK